MVLQVLRLVKMACCGVLWCPVFAATHVVDFNTATELPFKEVGAAAAEYRTSGGASGGASDGYLSITDARSGQRATVVFDDLDKGLVVQAFNFECDLRIGGGSSQPADGFSLNYVRANDPLATNGSPFAGTAGENDLPEEGSLTGLGIGFDTWQSGDHPGGIRDVVGISIRVDGQLLTQLPVPLRPGNVWPGGTYDEAPFRNLASTNENYASSMQTGALNTTDDLNGDGTTGNDAGVGQVTVDDPKWPLWVKNLKWEKFKAQLTEDGKVKIFWKGVELTPAGGLASSFTPTPGRLVFGGRTGGAWEVHHVDNVRLETVPANRKNNSNNELIAWWNFEKVESDGVSVKSMVGAYAGEIKGNGRLTDDKSGRPNGGRGFDISQSQSHILLESIGKNNPLNIASADDNVTITLWQKNNSNRNASSFWAVDESNVSHIFQAHVPWGDNQIYFDTTGCCGRETRLNASPGPDHDWKKWHLYSFVKRGGTKEIWIDGNMLISLDGYKPATTLNKQLFIGGWPSWDSPDAIIDDFAIWKGALGALQIAKLASGIKPSDLLFPSSLGYLSGPSNQMVILGQPVTFEVKAGPGVEYRWFKDGLPIPDNPRIDFSIPGQLRILEARFEDDGMYSARMSLAQDSAEITAQLSVFSATVNGRLSSGFDPKTIAYFSVQQGFSNVNNVLSVPDIGAIGYVGPVFREVTESFTIELLVKPQAAFDLNEWGTSGQRYAVFPTHGGWAYGGGHAGVGVSVGTNGVAVYEHSDGYMPRIIWYPVPITEWTHVAVIVKDRVSSLYVDGKFIGDGPKSNYILHPSAGGDQTQHNYGPFVGLIDEITIWNTAVLPTTLGCFRRVPLVGTEAGLVGYWNFDDGVGRDFTGQRNAFKFTGTAGFLDKRFHGEEMYPIDENGRFHHFLLPDQKFPLFYSAFQDLNRDGILQSSEPQTLVPTKVDGQYGVVTEVELKLVDPLLPVPDLLPTHSADFETGVPVEWNNNSRMERPGTQGNMVLGPLSNGSVSISLTNLPTHSKIQLLFDLIILRSMDGDEPWGIRVDGKEIFRTSFSNGYGGSQFYPNSWGGVRLPVRTGQVEGDNDFWGYSVYRLGYLIPHSRSSLAVDFFAENQESWNNEGWALDNVRLVAVPDQPVSFLSVTPSASVREGDPFRLDAVVAGDGQLRFQWYFNGQAILGANSRSYELASVKSSNFGAYEVEVQNHFSKARSQPISVSRGFVHRILPDGYFINKQVVVSVRAEPPEGTSVYSVIETIPIGWTLVSASHGGTWDAESGSVKFGPYLDALARELAYTIKPPAGSSVLALWKGLTTSNDAQGAVTGVNSIPSILAPTLSSSEVNFTVNEGDNLKLSMVVSGTFPIQFQWFKDGVALAGGTNASVLVNSQVAPLDSGLYELTALNPAGQAKVTMRVVVVAKPRWVTLPVAKILIAGQGLSLSAVATGGGSLRYVWRQNGETRPAFTGPTVTVPVVTPSNAGVWTLEVINSAGSVVSGAVLVTVLEPPVVTTQPVDIVVLEGDGFELRVVANGTAPINWEWRRDGQVIPGENGPVLRRNKASVLDEGSYMVTLRNGGGTASSQAAVVRVKVPFVTRILPVGYWPGVRFVVRLRSEPRSGTSRHEILEMVPSGWSVLTVSEGGKADPEGKTVLFGPYTDARARDLSYTLLAPSTLVSQVVAFSGNSVADGLMTAVRGGTAVGRGPYHPADLAARDGRIGISEVTKYAASWKRGDGWPDGPTPIPVGFVTRAGLVWRQGELYKFDPESGDAPRWWVVPQPRVLTSEPSTTTPIRARRKVEPLEHGRWKVTVFLDPGAGALAQALEETVSAGGQVLMASDGATWQENVVRWGPFFDDRTRNLSYEVQSETYPNQLEGVTGVDGWMIRVVPMDQRAPASLSLIATDKHLWIEVPIGTPRFLEKASDLRCWTPVGRLPDSDQPVGLDIAQPEDGPQFFRIINTRSTRF